MNEAAMWEKDYYAMKCEREALQQQNQAQAALLVEVAMFLQGMMPYLDQLAIPGKHADVVQAAAQAWLDHPEVVRLVSIAGGKS